MRRFAAAIAGLALIALMVPASGDGDDDKEKRNYKTDRAEIKIYVDGLDDAKHSAELKKALKSKFKPRATISVSRGDVMLKVRHNVQVKLSELQRVMTIVARRYKTKFVASDARLKGKVELKIKAGKKRPTPEQVAQLVATLKKLEGVVIQGNPKTAISPLRMMCADPGTSISDINEAVAEVFGLDDEAQSVIDVTWFGPKGRDPRQRPTGGGRPKGSKH